MRRTRSWPFGHLVAIAALAATVAACMSTASGQTDVAATLGTEPEGQRPLPTVSPPAYETIVTSDVTVQRLTEEALFPIGSAEVTAAGEANLGSLVAALPLAGPIEVHGYTDGIGTSEHNLELSRQRADAVVAWLVGQGIDGSRLVPTPHGEEGAVDDVDDPAKRRVEIAYETETVG